MEFLLISIGSHGDVHPFVGLGSTLLARGHQVSIIANAHFKPMIRKCGMEFIELGTDREYRELAGDPNLWKPSKAFEVVMGATASLTRKLYQLVATHVVPGQTVVAASSLALGARVAQDEFKFPMATIHLAPSVFRSIIDPPKLPGVPSFKWLPRFVVRRMFAAADRFIIDKLVAPPVNAIRKEHGQPPVHAILRDWWHSPDLVIGMFPEWFAAPAPDWPKQVTLTGFPLWDERSIWPMPQEMYDFLNSGQPPIVFTPGSAMWQAQRFFKTCIEACNRLGYRGILLTRQRDHVPQDLPNYIRHFEYAPFSELLPHVAALVHHGGIGTSSQALAAGVRQVVMPMAHDQLDNAARLQKLGVAQVLPPKEFSSARLAKMLSTMFADREYYVRGHWVSEWFKSEQPLIQTAKLLEQLGTARGVKSPAVTAVG